MIQLTPMQWLNVAAFSLGSLAMGAWWQSLLSPQTATFISGGVVWVASVINFIATGKTMLDTAKTS